MLSVTFQNRTHVVAGYADSTIRVFDIRNASMVRQMSVGAGPGGSKVLVWTVKCLANGYIVSGDSTGEVRFWDGKTYSQLQRISSHEADVLALAASENGQILYSAGMDRRTVSYRLADEQGKKRQWTRIAHRRYHDHDVKAMATFESPSLSVVVSGGMAVIKCVYLNIR